MAKSSNSSWNVWLRRFVLGGVGALGILSSSSINMAQRPTPSAALQAWIADSRRKEKQDGYTITALSRQSSSLLRFAAHRSHRSHASHYSSRSGHRSHYSHFSSYTSPVKPPKKQEEKKKPVPVVPPIQEKKPTTADKKDVKPKIEVKTGKVKSVISQTVLILEDATIVELIGVKAKKFSDLQKETVAAASARSSLTKWVKGKSIRAIFLEGNKAYLFVFLNELECRCVNLELIREGVLIADSDTSIYAHHVLLKTQKDAQKKGVGVWSKKLD